LNRKESEQLSSTKNNQQEIKQTKFHKKETEQKSSVKSERIRFKNADQIYD